MNIGIRAYYFLFLHSMKLKGRQENRHDDFVMLNSKEIDSKEHIMLVTTGTPL
jgi:hypothetical protein